MISMLVLTMMMMIIIKALAIALKLMAVYSMKMQNRIMKKMTITLTVCVCITRVFAYRCVILIYQMDRKKGYGHMVWRRMQRTHKHLPPCMRSTLSMNWATTFTIYHQCNASTPMQHDRLVVMHRHQMTYK